MYFLLLALIYHSCIIRNLLPLQLYAELLLARFALLDNPSAGNTPEPDAGVREAVASIIYAAPRVEVKGELLDTTARARSARGTDQWLVLDLPELQVLRDILMHKVRRPHHLPAYSDSSEC